MVLALMRRRLFAGDDPQRVESRIHASAGVFRPQPDLRDARQTALVELGIFCLVSLALLFSGIGRNLWGMMTRAQRRDVRALLGAMFAFIVTEMIYQWKGWFLDLDPLNVYFWVFLGICARLSAED